MRLFTELLRLVLYLETQREKNQLFTFVHIQTSTTETSIHHEQQKKKQHTNTNKCWWILDALHMKV